MYNFLFLINICIYIFLSKNIKYHISAFLQSVVVVTLFIKVQFCKNSTIDILQHPTEFHFIFQSTVFKIKSNKL